MAGVVGGRRIVVGRARLQPSGRGRAADGAGTNPADAGRRRARHHQAAGGGQGRQLVAGHRRRSDRRRRRSTRASWSSPPRGTAPHSRRFSRRCSTWGRRSTCSTPRRGRRSPPTLWPPGRTGSTTPSSSTWGISRSAAPAPSPTPSGPSSRPTRSSSASAASRSTRRRAPRTASSTTTSASTPRRRRSRRPARRPGRRSSSGPTARTPSSSTRATPIRPTAADSATTPLLVDASGNVYAATRKYPDGREALALTFGQAPTYVSYLELAYGLVSWATRGLFVGERHVYAMPQIDDLFLSSAIYTGGVYRITDADMQAFADWQTATRANPLTAGFRAAWAVQRRGLLVAPRRSADREGGRARADVRVDQPQLGSPGARRAQLRRRAQRVHAERSVSARARPHALRDDQRGDAQHLGARQRGCHAGDPRHAASSRS